jgi:hypothetical protein
MFSSLSNLTVAILPGRVVIDTAQQTPSAQKWKSRSFREGFFRFYARTKSFASTSTALFPLWFL